MALSPEDLDQVGIYVKTHLPEWLPTHVIDLSDRITRVEEELKTQRELMQQGFSNMDKRFEDMQLKMDKRFESMDKRFEGMQHHMDKRFESMDKRFEDVQHHMDKRFSATQWFMGTGFAALILLVTLLEYLS